MKKEIHIQGLRAIAVVSVILFHTNRDWLPGGFIGVDIFFVISGYLIASILIRRQRSGDKDLISFCIGRVRRIVPAYLVMLATVTAACYYLMVYSMDFIDLWNSLISTLYFNSANYFSNFGGYFSQAAYELPFQHTWTLAVEMQFYLLLPFALLFIPERLNRFLIPIVCAILFAISEHALRSGGAQTVYFSLAARIPEFLIGTMVALYGVGNDWKTGTKNVASICGLALIAIGLIAINEARPFPGLLALVPCIGTALLIASRGGLFAPALGSAAMVLIGDLSYSLYLWHWPVLALARYVHMGYALPISWVAALFVVIAGVSWFSFRFVETPFRKGGNKLLFGVLVPMAVASVCVAIPLKDWQIQRMVSVTPRSHLSFMTDAGFGYNFMYADTCFGSVHGDCLRGDRDSKKSPILVIGDSQAAQLARFFDVVSAKMGSGVRVIASPSCATIPGLDKELIHRGSDKACAGQTAVVAKYIGESNPIVIAASWEAFDEAAMKQVAAFVEEQTSHGKRVLVLSEMPRLKIDPTRALHFADIGIPAWTFMRANGIMEAGPKEANDQLRETLGEIPGYSFVDLTDIPLFRAPPYYLGDLMYFNPNHLNENGSYIYGQQAVNQFVAAADSKPAGNFSAASFTPAH